MTKGKTFRLVPNQDVSFEDVRKAIEQAGFWHRMGLSNHMNREEGFRMGLLPDSALRALDGMLNSETTESETLTVLRESLGEVLLDVWLDAFDASTNQEMRRASSIMREEEIARREAKSLAKEVKRHGSVFKRKTL